MNKRLCLLMWAVSALWPVCRLSAQPGLYVDGRFLYDGCSGSPDCADLNGSGNADFADFALMGQNYGR